MRMSRLPLARQTFQRKVLQLVLCRVGRVIVVAAGMLVLRLEVENWGTQDLLAKEVSFDSAPKVPRNVDREQMAPNTDVPMW